MVTPEDRGLPIWRSSVSCIAFIVGLVALVVALISRDWGLWFMPLYWLIPLSLLPQFFRWCESFLEGRSSTLISLAAFVGGAALIGIASLSSVPGTFLGDFVAEWNVFGYLFNVRLSVMILTVALAAWVMLSSVVHDITTVRWRPLREVAATVAAVSAIQLPVFLAFTTYHTIQVFRLVITVGGAS